MFFQMLTLYTATNNAGSLFLSAEAVNINSGLGFNGFDDAGRAKWNLINNADILKVEV